MLLSRSQQRSGPARSRFPYAAANHPRAGCAVDIETHTFRALTRTRAPILSSRTRIVVHCPVALFVPARPNRRGAAAGMAPPRLVPRFANSSQATAVLGQSAHLIDLMFLAPVHQFLAAEARVGAQTRCSPLKMYSGR